MPDQIDGLLSPWLRQQRIRIVHRHLQGKVLDYGCGVGKLAEICSPDSYVGVDIDEESLQVACVCYPEFRFEQKYPGNEQFDTIVLLAVIEHIKDPGSLLTQLQKMLRPNGRIVVTTPHPAFGWFHWIGSRIGLCSLNANVQHEQLIDYDLMNTLALKAGLVISSYKRFLLGANQLFLLASAR